MGQYNAISHTMKTDFWDVSKYIQSKFCMELLKIARYHIFIRLQVEKLYDFFKKFTEL